MIVTFWAGLNAAYSLTLRRNGILHLHLRCAQSAVQVCRFSQRAHRTAPTQWVQV